MFSQGSEPVSNKFIHRLGKNLNSLGKGMVVRSASGRFINKKRNTRLLKKRAESELSKLEMFKRKIEDSENHQIATAKKLLEQENTTDEKIKKVAANYSQFSKENNENIKFFKSKIKQYSLEQHQKIQMLESKLKKLSSRNISSIDNEITKMDIALSELNNSTEGSKAKKIFNTSQYLSEISIERSNYADESNRLLEKSWNDVSNILSGAIDVFRSSQRKE